MAGPVKQLFSSLPGLTRQSIFFERLFAKMMDTRVKPAYDENNKRA
jgi:hypothetical protein